MRWPWSHTNFRSGGCQVDLHPNRKSARMCGKLKSDSVQPYPFVDARYRCCPADDQGQTNLCVIFGTCAMAEVAYWKRTMTPKQFDIEALLAEAMKDDPRIPDQGTTLEVGVKAALRLGWFPGHTEAGIRYILTPDDFRAALHQHDGCLCAFQTTTGWNRCDTRTGYIGDGWSEPNSGHCVWGHWYSDVGKHQGAGFQNSWGKGWGVEGNGRMPWDKFEEQFYYGIVLEA